VLKEDFVTLWPGLKHFFIESLQLVSVHCAGDCRVWLQKFLVDYPIYVPPNRQQNLARMEFTFGRWFWLFISIGSLPLPGVVNVQTPLLITGYQMIQPRKIP
jgi:hypothetical protein